jgi:acetyltransferase-like isoleucine patch superfamily enzyme
VGPGSAGPRDHTAQIKDPTMNLTDFLAHVDSRAVIEGGSEAHEFMHGAAQDAFRMTAQINNGYRTPEQMRALLAELTGKPVDESVVVFPPFHTEFGKNLTLGRNVFINLGCRFQDTGGITIGDGTLIGHGSTLTTSTTTSIRTGGPTCCPPRSTSVTRSGWALLSRSCRASPSATERSWVPVQW